MPDIYIVSRQIQHDLKWRNYKYLNEGSLCLLTWQPTEMWSLFQPHMQQRLWRQKKTLKGWKVKPEIIDCNKFVRDVDRANQNLPCCPYSRELEKWIYAIFAVDGCRKHFYIVKKYSKNTSKGRGQCCKGLLNWLNSENDRVDDN